jgi:hypothetical protein
VNKSKLNSERNHNQDVMDLLSLANSELEEKSKIIRSLSAKIEILESKNFDNLEESELEELKDYYGSKLSSIVAALNNLTKNKSHE